MATVTERLELLVDAKTGGAISELRKLDQQVQASATQQQKAGGAAGFLQTKLQNMGLSAGAAGTVLSTALPVAAATAGAAMLQFGKDSVQASIDLADGVRIVQQATGEDAEISSRLVAIMDDYGVTAEAGAKAFVKLGINADGSREKLEAHGVKVKENKDGTLDFVGTLENVADAYKNSSDAGERDKLVLDAFGKSGRDLIPILEQGRAGIEKMFADVPRGQILTQDQIDAARQYKLAMDNLSDSVQEVKIALGNELIPILGSWANTLAEVIRKTNDARGAVMDFAGGITGPLKHGIIETIPVVGPTINVMNDLGSAFGLGGKKTDEYAEAQKRLQDAQKDVTQLAAEHKTHTDEGREAQKELTAATNDYEAVQKRVVGALADAAGNTKSAKEETTSYADAINLAADATKRYADNALEVIGLNLGVEASEQQVEEAIKAHSDALTANGEGSLEAREAQTRLEQSVLAATGSVLKAAEAQAELEGKTLSSADKMQVQRDELNKLKERYPELEGVVNNYLWTLGKTPTTVRTTAELLADDATARLAEYNRQLDLLPSSVRTNIFADIFGGVTTSRQHGGPIPGGVNEPFPIIAHGGEYVLSADVVDRIKAGRQSRGAAPPSFTSLASSGGNGNAGPLIINLSLNGDVLGSAAVDYINRRSTRGPGPLLSGATVG